MSHMSFAHGSLLRRGYHGTLLRRFDRRKRFSDKDIIAAAPDVPRFGLLLAMTYRGVKLAL
jgi:hypothetical protein